MARQMRVFTGLCVIVFVCFVGLGCDDDEELIPPAAGGVLWVIDQPNSAV
jgi:hypothetical protein